MMLSTLPHTALTDTCQSLSNTDQNDAQVTSAHHQWHSQDYCQGANQMKTVPDEQVHLVLWDCLSSCHNATLIIVTIDF